MAVASVAVALQTCGREPTGPAGGAADTWGLALALAFPPPRTPDVDVSGLFNRIRLIVTRLNGAVAVDRTLNVAAFADSLVLGLAVPLAATTPAAGEPMDVLVRCIGPLGDTVYAGGPARVLVRPGGAPAPVTISLRYTGSPADTAVTRLAISALAITTAAGTVLGGDGGVTVSALDAAGHVVTSFAAPVTVALTRGATPAVLGGTTTVPATAGVATFPDLSIVTASPGYALVASSARLPADTSLPFTIVAAAAHAIAALQGDGQSGLVGTVLPAPLRIAVTDAFGNAVSGVPVAWRTVTGGGTLASSATTSDVQGITGNAWTLGLVLGAQTASAAASGLAGSPVTFTATGLATSALHAIIATPGGIGTTAAGATLGAAAGITVSILDAAGAVVTSFNGPVTMAIGQNPGGATLGGTTTVNAVSGVATFTDLVITKAASGYTLVASAAGLPGVTSNTFSIVAAAAQALALAGGNNQSALVNALLPQPLQVLVTDAYGNPVSGASVAWSVLTGGGALQSGTSTTNGSGVASNQWTLGTLLGTQTASAAASGLSGSPVAFSASALPLQQVATRLVMSALPVTGVAGAIIDAVAGAAGSSRSTKEP